MGGGKKGGKEGGKKGESFSFLLNFHALLTYAIFTKFSAISEKLQRTPLARRYTMEEGKPFPLVQSH